MTDTVTKKKRSEIMRAVRSKDSKIEIAFRKALWKAGFRYRKNANLLILVFGMAAKSIAAFQRRTKNIGSLR